jgi:hypothetical protein
VLATAVLADPERLRAGLVGAELTPVEARVVITPGRPVACAGPAVAARLAGQTPENCVTLPWRELAALPWL